MSRSIAVDRRGPDDKPDCSSTHDTHGYSSPCQVDHPKPRAFHPIRAHARPITMQSNARLGRTTWDIRSTGPPRPAHPQNNARTAGTTKDRERGGSDVCAAHRCSASLITASACCFRDPEAAKRNPGRDAECIARTRLHTMHHFASTQRTDPTARTLIQPATTINRPGASERDGGARRRSGGQGLL